MASIIMTSSNGFKVLITKTVDENEEECVTIQNTQNNHQYLTCHDDRKHFWWNDTDESWNWEHFYPEVLEDDMVTFKTHFGTYMCIDEHDQSVIWQCDDIEWADVNFTKAEESDQVSSNTKDKVVVVNDDSQPPDNTTTTEEENASPTKSESSPKRQMTDEHKAKIAIGRKAKALFDEENRSKVAIRLLEQDEAFDAMNDKDKKKAVKKELTKLFKSLPKEDKKKYEDLGREE